MKPKPEINKTNNVSNDGSKELEGSPDYEAPMVTKHSVLRDLTANVSGDMHAE